MERERQRQLSTLTRIAEASSGGLSQLLHDFGNHLEHDMVDFLRRYMYALELDFELAVTRGSGDDLLLIVEDMRELCVSTASRLRWLGLPARPPDSVGS